MMDHSLRTSGGTIPDRAQRGIKDRFIKVDQEEQRIKDNEREVNDLRKALAEDVDLRGFVLHRFEKSLGWLTGSISSPAFAEPVSLLVEFPPGYPSLEPPRFFFPKNPGNRHLENLTHAVRDVATVYQKNKRRNPDGRCLEDCLVYVCRVLQNIAVPFSSAPWTMDDRSAINVVGSNNSAALTMMMASLHNQSGTNLGNPLMGASPFNIASTYASDEAPFNMPVSGSTAFGTSGSSSDFLLSSSAGTAPNNSFIQQQFHQPLSTSSTSTRLRKNSHTPSLYKSVSNLGNSGPAAGDSSSASTTSSASEGMQLLVPIRIFDDDEWLLDSHQRQQEGERPAAYNLPKSQSDEVSYHFQNARSHNASSSPVIDSDVRPMLQRRRCGACFGGCDSLVVFTTILSPVSALHSPGSSDSAIGSSSIGLAVPITHPGGNTKGKTQGTAAVWDSDDEDGSAKGTNVLSDRVIAVDEEQSLLAMKEKTAISVLPAMYTPSRYSLESSENHLVAPSPTARLAWRLLETCPENPLSVHALRTTLGSLERDNDVATLAVLSARLSSMGIERVFPIIDSRVASRYQQSYVEQLQRSGDFFARCALEKMTNNGGGGASVRRRLDCEWKYHPQIQCVLCRTTVNSSVTFCVKCHHGGHRKCLADWPEEVCPSGCGCRCRGGPNS